MGAGKAEKQSMKLQEKMAQQSLDLQKAELSKPKIEVADNFAANKLKGLSKLRLGIASTISAPAINSMKTKLGV